MDYNIFKLWSYKNEIFHKAKYDFENQKRKAKEGKSERFGF